MNYRHKGKQIKKKILNKSTKSLEINKKGNTNNKSEKKPKSVMIGTNETSKVKLAIKTFETFV
jgi:hypothetical protein